MRGVVAGHIHRGGFDVLGGCGVFACPSTSPPGFAEIGMTELRLVKEPAALAVHALLDGGVVSLIEPIS